SGAQILSAIRAGRAPDVGARRAHRLRAEGWAPRRARFHEPAEARHPRRQPGGCRDPGPASGEHDPLHLQPPGARSPRHRGRAAALLHRAGEPRRHTGRHPAGTGRGLRQEAKEAEMSEQTDWKTQGVRVIPANSLDVNTAQTPGMNRAAAINLARVGAQKIWAGTVSIHPNAKTGAHHHGALESVIYVVKGRARM